MRAFEGRLKRIVPINIVLLAFPTISRAGRTV
jgi:hypothetical protein